MYCIDPTVDEPIMLINRHIGFDVIDGMGIDGAEFQAELLWLDGMDKKRIQVWINSPGGVVLDGYNIFCAIMDTKTPVDTYAKGMVASIAGPIFMAGRKRYMTDYSSLMMHNPFGGDDKKALGVMKDSIATMLTSKSHLTMDQVNYMMDKTTWMNPSECLQHGFCNEIEVTSQGNKKYAPATKAELKTVFNTYNKIINNSLNIEIMTENIQGKVIGLSLIANYLGLNTEATENSVLTEVQARINAEIINRTKAEDATNAAKKELETAKAELTASEDKFKKMSDAYDALVAKNKADVAEAENKAKVAEKEAATVKAKTMVEGFVKTGKIKSEAVEKWTGLAVADFDGIKSMLDELPVNVHGKKLETVLNTTEGTGYSAAAIMANIAAKTSKA